MLQTGVKGFTFNDIYDESETNIVIPSVYRNFPVTKIDDYLFTKYNISNEIRKHIEKLLPDYYNIRKGRD